MALAIELWVLAILLPFIATVGFIGNTIMVVAFFRFKKLRSPCHYLITMSCIADGLHNTSQFIFTVHMLLDFQSSQFLCYLMNIPALLGVLSGALWMLALGFDRLLACWWPISYRSLIGNAFFYICAHFAVPSLFTFLFLYTAFLETSSSSIYVTCAIPLAMGNKTFKVFSTVNLVLILLNVLLYSLVYFIIQQKKDVHGKKFAMVFKPIFTTVLMVNIGWMITGAANSVATMFVENEYHATLIRFYAGIPVTMACASNVFVFYCINHDYRVNIRSLFTVKSTKVAGRALPQKVSTVTVPPRVS